MNVILPESDKHFANFELGKYQRDTWVCALEYCEGRRTFIDVGAHIGHFSHNAAVAGFEHIWAFEPIETNFRCLVNNVCPEQSQLHAMKLAVGDRERSDLVPNDPSDGLNSGAWELRSSTTVGISMVPLDSLMDLFTTVDLIKIDTQGWEREVLDGARKLIRRDKPVLIVEMPATSVEEHQDMTRWVSHSFTYTCHAMIGRNSIFFPRRPKDNAEAG